MKVTPIRSLQARFALVALLLAACSDDGTAPRAEKQVPGTIVPAASVQASGTVGAAAAGVPAVSLKDTRGRPMAGVAVTFAVVAGGGTVAQPSAVTDGEGNASAGSWTLGTLAGLNTVVARTAGLADVTFQTTAGPDQPASMSADPANQTTAGVGHVLNPSPAVTVKDRFGNSVPGATVTFTPMPGSGTLLGPASSVTNAAGLARAPSWSLAGVPGTQSLVATSGAVSTTLSVQARSLFNIEVRYMAPVSSTYQQAFDLAVQRWQNVIVGDLPSFWLNTAASTCGSAPAVNEQIDDIVIYVDLRAIDGVGAVLGQAGPCYARDLSWLPVLGWMQFDTADLDAMVQNNTLTSVIQHEIGHVLGIGTLWSYLSLLQGARSTDPYFSGTGAMQNYTLSGGLIASGGGVPVENTGGSGTRDSHWRETSMRNELMTGWISLGANPLSAITIQSLADMGYAVNLQAAETYRVPSTTPGTAAIVQQGTQLVELPMPAPRIVF